MYTEPGYENGVSQSNYLNESSYNFTNVKKQALTILYIFMMVFISISILLYISQVLNINQSSSKLLQLEEKLETIKLKNDRLEVELASKTSLAEIEKIAKRELNMIEPDKRVTLVYNNQSEKKEKFMADIPKEKFFLAQIYDKIISEVATVQAESFE
ncbi:septum formation initiator [Halanaerobium saccharolyticum]|uniref:Septum formation initiator n=1 Tax=Halanaerobium saccharolyticum TaxID=43595 RepID=A0A4R6LKH0_9FIRM|nr:septum formation initiator family protein [Halanaerobium saccharolyticum]TDO83441.1 septum formation initiator [Halanaerobium saccharolyticum]